jgi:hypothetical protein
MKIPIASPLLVLALAVVAASSRADETAAPVNAQRFEALKKLAGDWVALGKDGKPTDKLVSSIRVTSVGSAVQETLFPGSDHEIHEAELRRVIQAATNKSESFNRFVQWLFFGGEGLIAENDRDQQRELIKYNHLVANCLIFHNVQAQTRVLRQLAEEGV